MTINILGYGNGKLPNNRPTTMGTAVDTGYAQDIAKGLAMAYPGQWFGYSVIPDEGYTRWSDPIRMSFDKASDYE